MYCKRSYKAELEWEIEKFIDKLKNNWIVAQQMLIEKLFILCA